MIKGGTRCQRPLRGAVNATAEQTGGESINDRHG